jgi:hypothetical protein
VFLDGDGDLVHRHLLQLVVGERGVLLGARPVQCLLAEGVEETPPRLPRLPGLILDLLVEQV